MHGKFLGEKTKLQLGPIEHWDNSEFWATDLAYIIVENKKDERWTNWLQRIFQSMFVQLNPLISSAEMISTDPFDQENSMFDWVKNGVQSFSFEDPKDTKFIPHEDMVKNQFLKNR